MLKQNDSQAPRDEHAQRDALDQVPRDTLSSASDDALRLLELAVPRCIRALSPLCEPRGYTDLKALGFSQAQARLTPGLLLPLYTTDGRQPLTIYRPDHPQPDANSRLDVHFVNPVPVHFSLANM